MQIKSTALSKAKQHPCRKISTWSWWFFVGLYIVSRPYLKLYGTRSQIQGDPISQATTGTHRQQGGKGPYDLGHQKRRANKQQGSSKAKIQRRHGDPPHSSQPYGAGYSRRKHCRYQKAKWNSRWDKRGIFSLMGKSTVKNCYIKMERYFFARKMMNISLSKFMAETP